MRLEPRPLIIATVAVALGAHLVLLLPGGEAGATYMLQSAAVFTLCALLPGTLIVDIVVGRSSAPPSNLERIVLSIGMGFATLVIGMVVLSYLPGPLATWMVFAACDLVLLALLAAVWWSSHRATGTTGPSRGRIAPDFPRGPVTYWLAGGLIAVLLTGTVLRFGNAGYAEFHGDEARAVLRAAAVIQGYEDVLFLHKKGPAEILIPTANFALAGRVTEGAARFPFAVAGLTTLLAVFLLGNRMFGPLAGFSAAALLAVDGYSVAFSRIVQYQSIVILLSVSVILILYRLLKRPQATLGYLVLASSMLATGLMAHYEAAFVLLPALWLTCVIYQRYPRRRRKLIRSAVPAIVLGGALTALFYAPFVLHPQFRATYTYLAQRRLGIGADGGSGAFPFNNLVDFFTRTTTYNSTYYVLFLFVLTAVALVIAYRRGVGRFWCVLLSALLLLGLAVLLAKPAWLVAGGRDFTVLLFVVALTAVWVMPNMRASERTLWLWFGVPLLLLLFFTAKPRTHVYVFSVPWLLIAGMTLERAWLASRRHVSLTLARTVGVAAAALALIVFGTYTYLYFVFSNVEILRTWQENRPSAYWTAYDALDNRALFGFPLRNGWKVVGRLYAMDEIEGAYATNEFEFWTPAWYTRGEWRCEDHADWFYQIFNFQPDPEGYARSIDAYVSKDFKPWARVTVDGDPRMIIHQRSQDPLPLQFYPLEAYEKAFDAAATADLPLNYPVVEPPIAHRLHVNLGDAIWLEGYDLEYAAPIQPGDQVDLTLYWRAQRPIDQSYKVFNQSFYGDGVMVAQQDGYPVCGARGTWLWDPGELIVDRHTITLKPDAPAGLYPLYTGLYIQETLERLDVLDSEGTVVGDKVHLTDIRVGEE